MSQPPCWPCFPLFGWMTCLVPLCNPHTCSLKIKLCSQSLLVYLCTQTSVTSTFLQLPRPRIYQWPPGYNSCWHWSSFSTWFTEFWSLVWPGLCLIPDPGCNCGESHLQPSFVFCCCLATGSHPVCGCVTLAFSLTLLKIKCKVINNFWGLNEEWEGDEVQVIIRQLSWWRKTRFLLKGDNNFIFDWKSK